MPGRVHACYLSSKQRPFVQMANRRDPRAYPDRPFVAVSAAIWRANRLLLVRRNTPPARLYTLPGGVVEAGETLHEALRREVQEETGIEIEPVALAGYREFILRDESQRVARHFIILAFSTHWRAGEPILNEELGEAHWIEPGELGRFETTEGLQEIVAASRAQMDAELSRADR